jgi:hypothetical protein
LHAPTVGFGQVFIPSVDLPFVVLLSSTWLTTEAARLRSCPSPRVQSLALASAARRSPLRARRSARNGSYGRSSMGSVGPSTFSGFAQRLTLSRRVGFASPDSAAPSGFLSLLALYSVRIPSDLVSCRSRPWACSISRGFPSKVARSASRTASSLSPKGDPAFLLSFTVCPCPPCRYGSCIAPRLMRSAPLDFEDFSSPGVRSPRTGFTRDPRVDSSLDLLPLRGLPLGRPRLVCLHTSLLSWASSRCPAVAHRHRDCSAEFSRNRRGGTFSFERVLPP